MSQKSEYSFRRYSLKEGLAENIVTVTSTRYTYEQIGYFTKADKTVVNMSYKNSAKWNSKVRIRTFRILTIFSTSESSSSFTF